MELNDVKLFGRVVKDAEFKTSPQGTKIATFSIANRKSKSKNEENTKTADFFPLVIYGEYAEKIYQYLKKGQKVIIDGFLKQNKWEKDGVKKSQIMIVVKNLQLISDSQNHSSAANENKPAINMEENENFENEIPEEEIYSDEEALY